MTNGSQLASRSELDRLMEQYGSSLLRMSAIYLKDADLAQDAVQETFIKAYRHMNDYRGDSSEKTWLTTICVNTCRDILRTAWFRHTSRMDLDTLPEKPAEFEFPDNTVLTEVMRLPAKYREVILLRYYEGSWLLTKARVQMYIGSVRSLLLTTWRAFRLSRKDRFVPLQGIPSLSFGGRWTLY